MESSDLQQLGRSTVTDLKERISHANAHECRIVEIECYSQLPALRVEVGGRAVALGETSLGDWLPHNNKQICIATLWFMLCAYVSFLLSTSMRVCHVSMPAALSVVM